VQLRAFDPVALSAEFLRHGKAKTLETCAYASPDRLRSLVIRARKVASASSIAFLATWSRLGGQASLTDKTRSGA